MFTVKVKIIFVLIFVISIGISGISIYGLLTNDLCPETQCRTSINETGCFIENMNNMKICSCTVYDDKLVYNHQCYLADDGCGRLNESMACPGIVDQYVISTMGVFVGAICFICAACLMIAIWRSAHQIRKY